MMPGPMKSRHSEHPKLFDKLSKAIDRNPDDTFLHLGYRLGFQPKSRSLLLWVFQGKKLITRFEQFGIHALGLHRQGLPNSELDPEHRRFAQHLLRFAGLNASEGYFSIPNRHVGFFLSKLSRFAQVEFSETGQAVRFSDHPLLPIAQLEEKSPTEIHLVARFQDLETERQFDFSNVVVFPGRRAWAFVDKTFFQVKQTVLTSLLEDFDPQGNLVLTGQEAADFIQDYLPQLSRKPEVVLPEGFTLPEVLQAPPQVEYEISEDAGAEKLILHIYFSYLGHRVPPYQSDADALIPLEKEGKTTLIRRDLAFEEDILKQYREQGFRRVGPARFESGGAPAMDFISGNQPQGAQSLQRFKLLGELGTAQVRAKALGGGMDWLDLDLQFEVGESMIPYETIQGLLARGEKYLQVPGQGFIRLRVEELKDLEDKFSELEGSFTDNGRLRIAPFHALYLNETLKVDWSFRNEIEEMLNTLKETRQIPTQELPAELTSILREYQHHGFNWMHFLHRHRFNGILADDMGLGKTIQALAYLQDLKDRQGFKPSLVLAPTSVVFNWAAEAEKFTPRLKALVFTGPLRKKLIPELKQADLVLTSYAIFRRDVELLTAQSWRTVVLDEAQNIKNYRSKTALLVKGLQTEQRWALTGTPLENRLSELWSIFDFLMPGFLGNYPHFKRKYQQPIEAEQSSVHLERLRRRIYPFVLRRLKSEVANELPPKTEVTQYCEMTHDQQKLYHEMLATCRQQVFAEVERRGLERSHLSILTALLRLRQICCHPELLGPSFQKKEVSSGKMEAFQDLVEEVLSEGHRVLVFSQFVEMLTLLRTWLEKEKIAYEYLDGRTRKREERIKRFNSSPDIPIFLVSLRAGGTGLNLTGADYVIHFDPWWNPAVQDQATDRVHRIGQTKHVFSYKLITKDTVEEKILMLQERKRELAKGLLSSDSALGKKLTREDLEYLFS